jgi:hypothetical protein
MAYSRIHGGHSAWQKQLQRPGLIKVSVRVVRVIPAPVCTGLLQSSHPLWSKFQFAVVT